MDKETTPQTETTPQFGFVRERYHRRPSADYEPMPGIETMGETFAEWNEIYTDIDILNTYGYRQGAARRMGLSEDTSWDEIYRFAEEQERRHYARKYGLPETATWDELRPHYETDESLIPKLGERYKLDRENLRMTAATELDVSENMNWETIFAKAVLVGVHSPEDVIKRLREIEQYYLDKIANEGQPTVSSQK